ncbi:hypothetical protein HGM15179_009677 [Zosterops borbonicus]|uniref:RAD51 interacting motif domain-containing protein n=1 Tax=Zosterops borbonicus TaxID=364589 RepID=A0A8K1GG27_9PASS|nr:hypothetical protein HGM15179_009677 [Zosterops borbonicus]
MSALHCDWVVQRHWTVSANIVLIFVSMKSAYSKRFLSSSPDETECYLNPRQTKTESDQKIREKKDQQKLEQKINGGSKCQTSPHKLLYLPERQNNWALEKQSCDTVRKTCMREFFSSETCNNEELPCIVSENEPPIKKWRPENEDQSPIEDDIPLNVCGQPLETELLNVSSSADTCQNLPVLNPPQVQQNNSIEKINKRNEDDELKQNSSVTSLNRHMFQTDLFSQNSPNIYQSVTLSLDSSSFVNREISEDGHCRNSSSADKQKTSETIPAMVQYLSVGSPAMTDTNLPVKSKETAPFSLQGHEQLNKTGSSEPATLKQHLEYVKEQEERNDEQMCVTNESQCETVMNYLIMSYSEDKSKTFIAAEEELKMPLSIMNNGCLEDVKDKCLPLENKITHEFELKRKFDLVLEELRMFHEISKENVNNLSSLETNLPNSYWELNKAEGIDENMARVSQRNICISSPICGTTKGKHITDINESSLHEKILNESEDQKVPKEYSISRMPSEELLHSPAEGAANRNPYTWHPAFLPGTLFKEQSYNLQKEGGYFLSRDIIRVQPLKTCKGPIRIGLSRKARPKKLHPYLK